MVAAFDVSRVSSNAARFDLKKAEAINAAHLRLLVPEDFAERVVPHLAAEGITDPDRSVLAAAAPLVQERSQVLSDAARMLAFLFRDEDTFTPDDDAAAKNLGADAAPVLEAAVAGLTDLPEWSAAAIEESLKTSLVDGLELKPRKAFAPVRVAISGRTVSPPLYESMELLGRERSLARLGAGVRRSQSMG
jgi:glutamyl-tRNA synthetase